MNGNNDYFKVLRPGINSTFQDLGRRNLNHIGIPLSGAMDIRNYKIANQIVFNKDETVVEFAYQGPLLKYFGEKNIVCITGNVNFNIIRKNKVEKGQCYQSYIIEEGDQLDILSTINSVYGYLSVGGGFKTDLFFGSSSTNIRAEVGGNNGKKIETNNILKILSKKKLLQKKKLTYFDNKIEFIRVLKGTNFNYFSKDAKKKLFSETFQVSKLSDRMGMRLNGPNLQNIINTNIKSEGIVKGVVQVPSDGNPIIMLSDHGTIGGYPKIANIISADFDKISQLPPGSKIKFKEVELKEAENLFYLYNIETQNLINQIN